MTPLRQRMLEDMQMRNLAPLTQSAYVRAVAQLAQHYGKAPDRISREEVRAYLVELIQQRQVSASRYNQVRCALRFFYQVTLGREWTLDHVVCQKTGRKLPVVLSRAEVARFFGAIRRIKSRAVFMTLYAAGLRVSEVVTLRVRDIDSQRMVIRVCQGKGKKDRYVMLSPKLLEVLRAYWRTCHPGAWLFAGQDRTRPLTCAAVRLACRRIARRAGLRKRVTPHTLRHSFATQLFENGAELPVIQTLLGHADPRDTMIYLHLATRKLRSAPNPLETLPPANLPGPEPAA